MIEAGARVIKLVDDFGMAGQVKAIAPKTIIIGRIFSMYDPMALRQAQGATEAADAFVEGMRTKLAANPLVTAWEGPNEPVCETMEKMAWYAAFEARRVARLAAMGLRAVIGNFSVGQPRLDVPVWEAFLPAIRQAQGAGGYLGLHEYSWPVMQWMYGPNQVDPDEDQGDEGWVTCRYRKVYRQYLLPKGLAIPLVITECGIDPGVNPKPFAGGGAWREDNLRRAWNEHFGAEDADLFYAEQLKWYDGELRKDGYVAGATIFTVGSFGPPWSNFDLAGQRVIENLCAYYATLLGDDGNGGDGGNEGNMGNLLKNADFDNGKHYHWQGVNEIVIPDGWDFWYADFNTPWLERQDQNFDPPECVVWNKKDADPKDYGFWLSGDYTLKIFKGWGVIWWRLFQKVTGLTVGSKYRFTAPVHPDLVMAYDGDAKIYANDPLAGEVQLSAGGAVTEWKTGFPFGEYTEHALEFTAQATEVEVSIEARCRWGLINDGWFVDSLRLELVATGPGDPGDETDPPPTGDTVSVKDLLTKALAELGAARVQVVKAEASVGAAVDLLAG